ncbi:MAG: DUF423 domain-containing protein [Verrucomicrobiales bacterium]
MDTDIQTSGSRILQRIAAVTMAAGVALGAYGAHGLDADAKGLANWKTAVLYHLIHGIVLYFLASRPNRSNGNGPWWCLFAGIVIFSGMLYAIVLTGVTWLGAIVPIGGLAMIVGWLWLAVTAK